MKSLVWCGVAASAGAVASLNFAPARVPGVFLLALVVLFFALRQATVQASGVASAAVSGAFAATFYGVGMWWLNAVSPAAWVALWAALVALHAFLGVALRLVMGLAWWPMWAASLWTGADLLRSSAPFKGFPWLRLSHTVLDTPADGVVAWVGLTATTWLMASVAAAFVVVAETRSWRPLVPVVVVTLLALAAPSGLAHTRGTPETLRVAAVQGNTPGPFGTWAYGDILRLHVDETQRITRDVDLVIWPENASDMDIRTDPYARDLVSQAAQSVGAPILVGAILDGPTSDSALNASVLVDPESGPSDDMYVKRFVVPYGEFVPFRHFLGNLVPRFDREIPRDMIAGTHPGALRAANTIVGTTICWDIAHDAALRDSVKAGASFIAVKTSNATFADFGRGVQPEQQWDISRIRAIETGRWVVVASTNGVSGFINPDGDIIEQLPVRTAAHGVEEISLADSETWATRVGGHVSWLIGALALSGLVVGIVKRRKESS